MDPGSSKKTGKGARFYCSLFHPVRSNPLLLAFFLLVSLPSPCKASNGVLETEQDSLFELHSKSPLGIYFRLGEDVTFRKYDRIFSNGGQDIATNFAISAFFFQVIRASVASVSGQWLASPIARETAGILGAFIFPSLLNSLCSWYTGQRVGSEQIKIGNPDIARWFYIELAYSHSSPDQHIRITPFPNSALTPSQNQKAAPANLFTPSVTLWQYLHSAAVRNDIESIDLSWHQHEMSHGIRVQLVYHDRHSLTAVLPITDSENLPESVESLLHNKLHNNMREQKTNATSLLNEAVIDRVTAMIEAPRNNSLPIPAPELISPLAFDDQGYINSLGLCGEKDDICSGYLQLVWEPLPIPHFRPVLFGSEHAVNSLSSALISQSASLNKAELVVQLIEQEALRRLINAFRPGGYSDDTDRSAIALKSHVSNAPGTYTPATPKHTETVKTGRSIITATQRVASFTTTAKNLLKEYADSGAVSKALNKYPVLRSLNPLTYRLYMFDPEASGASVITGSRAAAWRNIKSRTNTGPADPHDRAELFTAIKDPTLEIPVKVDAYPVSWPTLHYNTLLLGEKTPLTTKLAELTYKGKSTLVRVEKNPDIPKGESYAARPIRAKLSIKTPDMSKGVYIILKEYSGTLPYLENTGLKITSVFKLKSELDRGGSDVTSRLESDDKVDIKYDDFVKAFKYMLKREGCPVEHLGQYAFIYNNRYVFFIEIHSDHSGFALINQATNVIAIDKASSVVRHLNLDNDNRVQKIGALPERFDFSGNAFGIGGADQMLKMFIDNAITPRLIPQNLRLNIKTSRGGILYGPPGTGKTLFISVLEDLLKQNGFRVITKKVSGPEIFNSYIGQSELAVRNIFADDGTKTDAIRLILIDEIDSMLPRRGTQTGSTGVGDRVVNQFLTCLDGLEKTNNLLVFGTTNRRDLIDPAVTRPGRMDMMMHFTLPGLEERHQILEIHTQGLRSSQMLSDVNIRALADRTQGFTGAELEALVRQAVASALLRAQGDTVGDTFFSPKAVNHLETLEVATQDFKRALTQVKPQFGQSNFLDLADKNFYTGQYPEHEVNSLLKKLQAFRNDKRLATLRILVLGSEGIGKSTFAALTLKAFGADFCQYVTAAEVVELHPDVKKKRLADAFKARDVQGKTKNTGIVLDDFDTMIHYQGDRFYTSELVAVMDAHSKQPLEGIAKGKMLLIVTASADENFLPRVFKPDEVFNIGVNPCY